MRVNSLAFGVLLALTALLIAACGAVATPRPPAAPTLEPFTLAPRLAQGNTATEVGAQPTEPPLTDTPTEAPTATPTDVPPTATPTVTPATVGDSGRGEELFVNGKDIAPPCASCHVVDSDMILVGPSLLGIAERAATRVEGLSAEAYLRQSILEPNAYIVEPMEGRVFSAGDLSTMFQTYADYLTDEDVNDLIAYMLTLVND